MNNKKGVYYSIFTYFFINMDIEASQGDNVQVFLGGTRYGFIGRR
jgi:hypothetical protein